MNPLLRFVQRLRPSSGLALKDLYGSYLPHLLAAWGQIRKMINGVGRDLSILGSRIVGSEIFADLFKHII